MGRLPHGEGILAIARTGAIALGCLALAHCSSGKFSSKSDPKYGVASSPRIVDAGKPIPKGGGTYRVGKPYVIAGRTYVPEEDANYRADGIASWYGADFHGRLTANGEVFDMHSISAAHPTLPIPSYVRVTNLANKRSLIVRVNDRGPYAESRVIDLSVKSAQLLGFYDRGLARVRVEYVGRAPLEGSDDRQLVATLREGELAPPPSVVRVASAKPFLPEASSPDRTVVGEKALVAPRKQPPTLGQIPAPAPLKPSGAAAAASLSTPDLSPVSAFAPTGYHAPAAFISGRGLY